MAASTQNQALSALLFPYQEVLEIKLPWLGEVDRAERPQRVPVVLTAQETRSVLAKLEGSYRIMGELLCARRPVGALRHRCISAQAARPPSSDRAASTSAATRCTWETALRG